MDCGALCYSLEIKPTPLFGGDVNITANVSEVTHAIGRRWTRCDFNTECQHEYQLMYDGLHVDSDFKDKFTELIGTDVFTFTIHNLTDTDVNKTYKLFYGFDTCEVTLTFAHVHVLTNNDQSAESNRPSKVTMIAGIIAIGTVLGFLVLLVFVKICRRKRQVDQRRMLNKIEDPHNEDLAVHEQIMV